MSIGTNFPEEKLVPYIMNFSGCVSFGLVIPLLENSPVEIIRQLIKDALIEMFILALLIIQKSWKEVLIFNN